MTDHWAQDLDIRVHNDQLFIPECTILSLQQNLLILALY